MKKLLFYIYAMAMLFTSCMKDKEYWEEFRPQLTESPGGVFIINEGNLGYNNASLSWYDIENKVIYNNIFRNTNGAIMGDVAQSMQIRDSLAYITLNNSGKILIINTNTFRLNGKITGLTSPRYIHFLSDNKAYVSDLYARSIHIIDPLAMKKTGEINIMNTASQIPQHNADKMIAYKNLLFTNSWNFDNTLLIINTDTDMVTDSLKVPAQPNSLQLDKNNKLWVLCDGGYEGNAFAHEKPALLCIDPESHEILKSFEFHLNDSPTELQINKSGDTLYYINRHIYRYPISSESEPHIFTESKYEGGIDGGFYGLAVDPATSEIYVADAIDMVQNGVIYRFKADATPVDTVKAGIIPGEFCFR